MNMDKHTFVLLVEGLKQQYEVDTEMAETLTYDTQYNVAVCTLEEIINYNFDVPDKVMIYIYVQRGEVYTRFGIVNNASQLYDYLKEREN